MVYGITGNTTKLRLWEPVATLTAWLLHKELPFRLEAALAQGLVERELLRPDDAERHASHDLAADAEAILSFGGDGTFLNAVHQIGDRNTPVLGVNIGRLGFLAEVEVAHVKQALMALERGDYHIERRMVLEAEPGGGTTLVASRALNEFVLQRSGTSGLLAIEVRVDGRLLNLYWADGLIIATPTGSTAYSLSAGGPIMVPGCGALILTPLAPHTLTVRPLVLPDTAELKVSIADEDKTYVFTADGLSTLFDHRPLALTIRRAPHAVHLIKLPEQDYFETLRSKLMWGVQKSML